MKWVTMWANAQSMVVPSPAVYAKDLTLRYPVFIPFNGTKLQITLDNFCCEEDVEISALAISIGEGLSDVQTFVQYVTFQGERTAKIPAHGVLTTDEISINLEEGKYLIVSIYFEGYTKLTSGVDITGPLSKGYYAYGNQIESKTLDIFTSKATSWVYFLANIDIYTSEKNNAIICYGDSITSQDWPDYMLLALRELGIKKYSVVRKAVSGTRILREYNCITYQSYGKSGKNRFFHEVSSVKGARHIIIQHGINDIIHPVGEDINIFRPMSDFPSKEEMIQGLMLYKDTAERLGLEVWFGTLLPIYGWRTYQTFREELKNDVNAWLRRQKHIDFELEIGHLEQGEVHFNSLCDSGDHLHPSKVAYKLMGQLAAKKIIEEE